MTRQHTTTARFTVTGWDEQVVVDIDGDGKQLPQRGFTRADVTYAYSGAIEGTGTLTYLISYRPGAAPVVGFEHFTGSIDGHDGSLVLQHAGEHDAEAVRATLHVLEGLGTGGLEGLRGEATVELAGHSDDGYEISLAYDL
ncbi:DUF3224 family protein [Aeromicrobium sp. SMF47]|uniref:DUF3224 domain-containing protein n=1 Tax=Aeromicrobium TaxID=2040 RepID=UPI00129E4995|nr:MULTISPECIES: DUF3224 domain-containing protein [Aeromicrobium]MRJ76561.1 DUF3224 family protein [Aeromicrobium yanjiei]MRK00911.1 DUF3224 family protein [Aeromicrobium sp. S22]